MYEKVAEGLPAPSRDKSGEKRSVLVVLLVDGGRRVAGKITSQGVLMADMGELPRGVAVSLDGVSYPGV